MQRAFSQRVAPYVEAELANAKRARSAGGANVSPFRKMPIAPDLAALIQEAKSGA